MGCCGDGVCTIMGVGGRGTHMLFVIGLYGLKCLREHIYCASYFRCEDFPHLIIILPSCSYKSPWVLHYFNGTPYVTLTWLEYVMFGILCIPSVCLKLDLYHFPFTVCPLPLWCILYWCWLFHLLTTTSIVPFFNFRSTFLTPNLYYLFYYFSNSTI